MEKENVIQKIQKLLKLRYNVESIWMWPMHSSLFGTEKAAARPI